MRMDIEISPGAREREFISAARRDWGQAGQFRTAGLGRIDGMCLCPMRHPAVSRGGHARRLENEQGVGVLWRHSGVNLVEPRSFAVARQMLRPSAGMQSG
jgi:hypothetical protein